MTIEQQVLTFMINHNEMGYLPVNAKTTEALTKFIEDIVAQEKAND